MRRIIPRKVLDEPTRRRRSSTDVSSHLRPRGARQVAPRRARCRANAGRSGQAPRNRHEHQGHRRHRPRGHRTAKWHTEPTRLPRLPGRGVYESQRRGVPPHPVPHEHLQPGDIINVDVTTHFDGFHGDTSKTLARDLGTSAQRGIRGRSVRRRRLTPTTHFEPDSAGARFDCGRPAMSRQRSSVQRRSPRGARTTVHRSS